MGKLDGKKLKQVIDPTHAKVFTHPLRGHVWVTLFERGVVSPTEIANELELEPSDVSYHFRELNRKDLIRLVGPSSGAGSTSISTRRSLRPSSSMTRCGCRFPSRSARPSAAKP